MNELPDLQIPRDMKPEDMPDLLRYWYLGTRSRRHMVMRRFWEVDSELEQDGGPVLDIGSAWGYNVMALSRMGLDAVGLDLVDEQFEAGAWIAQENDVPFVVAVGDVSRLPFESESFRSITMVETFEHVFADDRPAAFAECFRVLTPGGRLVLSTPNYWSLVERLKRIAVRHPWMRRRLPTMCYPCENLARDEYHPYRYHQPSSATEITRALEYAGFWVRTVKYFLFAMKNTPDSLFALVAGAEKLLERTPGISRLAATVCLVADK